MSKLHAKPGYRYHHIGIPTTNERPGETFIAGDGVYPSGYFESPFAIEWLRFTADSPLPALIRNQPHVAFVVDNGAPVELIEFERPEHAVWPHARKVFEADARD